MIGTKLGPYEIRAEIGKGGMAAVYRAYQPSVDREVALKVILKGVTNHPVAVQRFQREARLIARLEHPHILPVYDFDGAHDPPYIVMRYLDGGSLKDVIVQGLLPHDEVAYLLQQVCSALDYAHRQGIVHRDVKPSNILIDHEGNAFVTDLGIARLVAGEPNSKQITETGAIIGTPDYMSPEQAMGSDDVDFRSDIYALGVMLFQMLTGKMPFNAESAMGLLMLHMTAPIPLIRALNPELPAAVEEVIQRVLAKNRKDRYQSAAEFGAAVTAAIGGSATTNPVRLGEATNLSLVRPQGKKQETDSKNTPTEQQKQLSVLYINLADLMEMIEGRAEDTLSIRSTLWQRIETILGEYGGTIENRTGDTALVLWGVQTVRENDAEQAVRAALAIQASAANLLSWHSGDEPLPVQIGIHTGAVMLTRSEDSARYTASGPNVNMASRLEQVAQAGSILVSQDTYNQVRGVFLVEGLEPVRFRGSKEAVPVYLVKGVKTRVFRRTKPAIEGIETRTIGREAELSVLIEALETVIQDGETQVVTIVGEAGVGKTRLIYELSEWEEKLPVDFWFFPGHATPQMISQPYALLRDVFTYRFEVLDSDSLTAVQEKFEKGVTRFMGAGSAEKAHVIAHLLGFDFSDSPYIKDKDAQSLNALALRYIAEFVMTVSELLEGSSGNEMTGLWLQLENIHWADERSLDFVNQLVEEQDHLRLAVICTARPSLYERRPTWGSGQDFHTRIDLRPLSRQSSRKLAREILQKVESIPDELRDLMVERSEGNPFYMEELVKNLLDDRVIIKGEAVWGVEMERLEGTRIPATLTGMLQARLDSLLPEERITLHRAAVVGRVFWDGAAQALKPADGVTIDVKSTLEALARRDLILVREETAFAGMKEFIFKSTMLRDVVYDGILKRQQRLYHLLVATWLIETSGERAHEYTNLIAEHYELAGDSIQAASYLIQVGEQARQLGAYPEAVTFLERGLANLGQDQSEAAKRLQATLRYQLGAIAEELGQYSEGLNHLQVSLSLSRELNDMPFMINALVTLGTTTFRQGQHDTSIVYLEEALGLARQTEDKSRITRALMWLGANAELQFQYDRAYQYKNEALDFAREMGEQPLLARTLNMLGETARKDGNFAQAAAYYKEALPIYQSIGHQYGVALVKSNLGHLSRTTGDIEASFAYYHDTLRGCREMRALSSTNAQESLAGIAGLNAMTGEYEKALELLGLVLSNPEIGAESLVVTQPVLDKLRAELPPDVVEAGLARGAALDLASVVKTLLGET